jgi:ribonuclease-3
MIACGTESFNSDRLMTSDRIEQIIAYTFKNPLFLQIALQHPVVQNKGMDFERLEFLGDRVLGLALADALYAQYPQENEGALAIRMAYLGSAKALKEIAQETGLEAALRTHFPSATFASIPSADLCEALLGAVYLDGGFTAALRVVYALWEEALAEPLSSLKDAKSALQEFLQEQGKDKPIYTELSRTGPDHSPMFCLQVYSPSDDKKAVGTGSSKRKAEQVGAAALLDSLRKGDARVV